MNVTVLGADKVPIACRLGAEVSAGKSRQIVEYTDFSKLSLRAVTRIEVVGYVSNNK